MTFTRDIKQRGKTYRIEVMGYRNKEGKVKQKFVKYVGRIENGKLIEPKYKTMEIDRIYPCGIQLMIESFVNENKFVFNSKHIALAAMHLINPSSINYLSKNLYRFGLDDFFGKFSASQFHTSLDLSEEDVYNKELELYKQIKKSTTSLFYDITSVYFYGTSCSLVKKGYSPKAILPQIKIGFAIDKEGMPIFHKVFRGNVYDGNTIPLFVECLKKAKIKRCTIVMDRGFQSEDNFSIITKNGYSLIAGVALKGKVKELMKREKAKLKCIVFLKNSYLYTKKIKWSDGNLVLCFNEKEACTIKNHVLRKKTKYDISTLGCYAIFCSNCKMSEKEIVKKYFEKDLIEKTFRSLKSVLGLGPLRSWLEGKVNSHLFICYISYLFLMLLQRKLKKIKKQKISTLQALDELKYVYKAKNKYGEKIITTTKNQKEILKALNIKV